MPNVKELQSLVDYGNVNPALPTGHPFDNVVSDFYWSSTTLAGNTTSAWTVGFSGGFVISGNKDLSVRVVAVRGGL